MIPIYYDDADDRIVIAGALQTYAPRTLMVAVAGEAISIRLKVRETNEFGPFAFADLMDGSRKPFASQAAAVAYLREVFDRRPGEIVAAPSYGALGGHRVISRTPNGIGYASCDAPESVLAVLGLTDVASEPGDPPSYRRSGPVEEPSWAWDLGPVYLGLDGGLTQVAPECGIVLQVGVSPSPTCLLVDLQEPYFLVL